MFKKTLVTLAFLGSAVSAHSSVLLNEGFNNIGTLTGSGWVMNNTTVGGTTNWFQGNTDVFTAQNGADESYIAANFNNAPVGGTISNWLITSAFSTEFSGVISFWAKGVIDPGFEDHFSFGLSDGSSDTAAFTLAALETATAGWTKYSYNFAGQGAGTIGRFAIRYSGDADTSNYIGIDSLNITAVPEPSSYLIMGIGLLSLLALRRRQQK
jgi:hypothetical protein